MTARRTDALRRLGGPVCPVCNRADTDVSVQVVGDQAEQDWLDARGKGRVVREGLAPMCKACHGEMLRHGHEVRWRQAEQERQSAIVKARAVDDMNRPTSRAYREAVAEYEDDLAAAEEIADEWGVGNGIFGDRSRD